ERRRGRTGGDGGYLHGDPHLSRTGLLEGDEPGARAPGTARGAEHDAGGLLGERGEADRAQRAEHGPASRQAADAEERARETVRGDRRPQRGCDRRLRRSAHAALVALADLVLGQELDRKSVV